MQDLQSVFPGINNDRLRARVPSIAAHIGGLAVDLASCTDLPFAEMIAAQLPKILENLLLKFIPEEGPPPMMSAGTFEATAEDFISNEVKSHGKIITPERLAMILTLLKIFFPVLPFAPK